MTVDGEYAACATCECKACRKTWPKSPPNKRKSSTYKLDVGGEFGGTDLYISTGEYDNGELCGIFIDLHKEGTVTRSLFNCLAIAVSLGLQYGVPLQTFINFFAHMRFDPSGDVAGYQGITHASSLIDCIFRLLGKEYIDKDRFNDKK